MNVNNSQVRLEKNLFKDINGGHAVCAFAGSKVVMGGTAAAANTVEPNTSLEIQQSSFHLSKNTIESNIYIEDIMMTIPGTGLRAGGEITENTLSEGLLTADQNNSSSYLRVFKNTMNNGFRVHFKDFPSVPSLSPKQELIFHSNKMTYYAMISGVGVRAENCPKMTFTQNTVNGGVIDPQNGSSSLIGVILDNVEDVRFYRNEIRYWHRGLQLQGGQLSHANRMQQFFKQLPPHLFE